MIPATNNQPTAMERIWGGVTALGRVGYEVVTGAYEELPKKASNIAVGALLGGAAGGLASVIPTLAGSLSIFTGQSPGIVATALATGRAAAATLALISAADGMVDRVKMILITRELAAGDFPYLAHLSQEYTCRAIGHVLAILPALSVPGVPLALLTGTGVTLLENGAGNQLAEEIVRGLAIVAVSTGTATQAGGVVSGALFATLFGQQLLARFKGEEADRIPMEITVPIPFREESLRLRWA